MLKLHVVALWGAAGVVLARRFDLVDDGLQLKLLAGCVAIAAGCALAMRCPFCRRRPFRQAMRESSATYHQWLRDLGECPACGSDGLNPPPVGGPIRAQPAGRPSLLVAMGAGPVAGIIVFTAVSALALGAYQAAGWRRVPGLGTEEFIADLIASAVGALGAGWVAGRLGAEWRPAHAAVLVGAVLVLHMNFAVFGPWPPWFRASLAASCVVPTLLGLRLGSRSAR
jgi:hypothetical protein